MRHELCSVDTFDTRSANETAPPTWLYKPFGCAPAFAYFHAHFVLYHLGKQFVPCHGLRPYS
eukprot:COSAG03_NODE_314_length_9077_cov_2.266095_3_plen_62_part_00